MAGDFSYVEGIDILDDILYYNALLYERSKRSESIKWIVLATYKDFKGGVLNHFIFKRDDKGGLGFYLRVYKERYKDLVYTDFLVGKSLPEESVLEKILVSGKI